MIPLIITACIDPKNTPYTSLQDPEERLFQYVQSIIQWLTTDIQKIIFVEGSGFEWNKSKISSYAHRLGKEIIWIYEDVIEDSCNYGKGRGESILVSQGIETAIYHGIIPHGIFYKCTGRLFPHPHILDKVSFGIAFGNWVDTRYYKCDINLWRNHIMTHQDKINDNDGYWMEHAVYDGLHHSGFKIDLVDVQFLGESGSHGAKYGDYEEYVKILARELLS